MGQRGFEILSLIYVRIYKCSLCAALLSKVNVMTSRLARCFIDPSGKILVTKKLPQNECTKFRV